MPWDLPGHHDDLPLSVPEWVSQDDALQTVNFTQQARVSLERHICNGRLSPLYTFKNDGLEASIQAITEILAQDPRATNTNNANKRGSKEGEASKTYMLVFCSVQIHFRVSNTGVIVEDITEIDLRNVLHVDGIPILIDR